MIEDKADWRYLSFEDLNQFHSFWAAAPKGPMTYAQCEIRGKSFIVNKMCCTTSLCFSFNFFKTSQNVTAVDTKFTHAVVAYTKHYNT